MLTQEDIKTIDKLLDKKFSKNLNPIKKDISKLDNKINKLDKKLTKTHANTEYILKTYDKNHVELEKSVVKLEEALVSSSPLPHQSSL